MIYRVLIGLIILVVTYFLYYKKSIDTESVLNISCFELKQNHVDTLRKSKVTMDIVESGAPMLAFELADIVFPGNVFSNEFLNTNNRNIIKGITFQIFIQSANLDAGKYSFENPFYNDEKHMKRIANTKLVELYKQKQINFNFTIQHAKLLKAANARYTKYLIGIDPKRPYKDATAFELDMADILGITLERDNEKNIVRNDQVIELNQFHSEMLPALQVLLKNGTINTGKYCRKTPYPNWKSQKQ